MDIFDLLKRHEGFRSKPYLCTAGKQTIGHGRNIEDVGINREEADYLLRNDVARAIGVLQTEPYWLALDEIRRAVCIDLCVNVGWGRYQGFRLFRAGLKAGDYDNAANELVDSAWYGQVGDRAKRLVQMMRSGEWPAE